MATELAQAYVQIVPSAKGISGSISNLLSGEAASAGTSSGSLFGNALIGKVTALIAGAAIFSKLKDAISDVIDLTTTTETAYAKLETIAGSDAIDSLTSSISALSSETGVAAADLADVAYNAISAGASTETAMDMVTAATKLGTAGFTDSSSALSVLSTIMNSYGDAAGDVTEISDSLIQVQNLGVTTVDELATSMGKAIATASAYSVDLGNLESAYVSLTKAGISTEESTTYLNSMLNELGDSGSDVSAILQEETGESFTQLMEDGYSLADVLSILYESCDEDSTALMNLWSSAEAGKASNAIVNQGLETFNENLEAITNSSGTTETAYETMMDTLESKMSIMETSFDNLKLKIGESLEEPLGNAIDFITNSVVPVLDNLADKFANDIVPVLTNLGDILVNDIVPAISSFVGWIKEMSPILAPIAAAIVAIVAAVKAYNTALTAYNAVSKLVTAAQTLLNAVMSANPFTIVALAVVALVAAIATLWTTNEGFRNAVTTAWEAIKNAFGTAIEAITGFFSGLWESVSSTVSSIFDTVSSIFTSITTTISGALTTAYDTVTGVWNSIYEVISPLLEAFQYLFETIWQAIQILISRALDTIQTTITNVWNAIYNVISPILTTIQTAVSTVFNAIKTTISNVLNAVKSVVSSVWNAIWGVISPILNTIKTGISNAFNTVKTTISNAMTTVKNTISKIVTSIKESFTGLVNSAKTWAKDMMNNFIQGIKDKISAVASAVTGVADKIKSIIGFSLPEDGPLSDADTYMPDFMELLADGISKNAGEVEEEADRLAQSLADSLNGDYEVSVGTIDAMGDVTGQLEGAAETNAARLYADSADYDTDATTNADLQALLALAQEYWPKLANLAVVLDDGTLVGSLETKLDRRYGKLTAYKARGN